MSISKTLAAGNAAAGVTISTGILNFLAENAPAIGIIITILSFFTMITFYTLNYLEKRRHHKAIEAKDD